MVVEVLTSFAPSAAVVDVGTKTALAVPSRREESEGSWTGRTNTMMQTRTASRAPATASNRRFRSIEPSRVAKKKPLSRKKRTMLTELFTRTAYQNWRGFDTLVDSTPVRC